MADSSVERPDANSSLGTSMPSVPVFDREGAMERLMGDEELLREILDGFLNEFPDRMEAIKACVASRDAETAQRAAHTIKGEAATIGGLALSEVALGMEKTAQKGDLDGLKEGLVELEKAFALFKRSVEE